MIRWHEISARLQIIATSLDTNVAWAFQYDGHSPKQFHFFSFTKLYFYSCTDPFRTANFAQNCNKLKNRDDGVQRENACIPMHSAAFLSKRRLIDDRMQ